MLGSGVEAPSGVQGARGEAPENFLPNGAIFWLSEKVKRQISLTALMRGNLLQSHDHAVGQKVVQGGALENFEQIWTIWYIFRLHSGRA